MSHDSDQPSENRHRTAWRRTIQDWVQSGKSQRHYCEDAGLSYQQFLRWRRFFEDEASSVSFATLYLSSSEEPVWSAQSSSLEIEVADKYRIKVTDQTSSQLLAMTLNCLEGLC